MTGKKKRKINEHTLVPCGIRKIAAAVLAANGRYDLFESEARGNLDHVISHIAGH